MTSHATLDERHPVRLCPLLHTGNTLGHRWFPG
jgi:hypothetical protein